MGKMGAACDILYDHIDKEDNVVINIDSDVDGYTSASIIMNFLYALYPEWCDNHLFFIHHKTKAHGLSDIMDEIGEDIQLVICPDSSTNDWNEQMELGRRGIDCIILDHHLIENPDIVDSTPAIVINVQNSAYSNKALTGAGVAYKFICAYWDMFCGSEDNVEPQDYLDLCALGNCGDMSSYKELETRAIIREGFTHLTNPFIRYMCQQHKYTLDKRNGVNYLSMAFGVVPFINAVTRSGTMEEKDIVFKGMLSQCAFQRVESSKRGESGVMVPLYKEAVLVAERVKRRQDKLVQETMELLERKIEDENLLDNAVLLFLCEPDEVEQTVAGLVANKFASKYQRPTLVLRRTRGVDDDEDFYRGSGRNYANCPIENFKDVLLSTGDMEFAAGHEAAFGAGIAASKIDDFIKHTNEIYKDVDFTPVYLVDYIWHPRDIDSKAILDIAAMDIWGQDMPQATIALVDIPLGERNVQILGLAKGHPTLKISCNGVEIMKFGSSEEEYEECIKPNKYLTAIVTCSKNEWNGNISPQLIVQDYEIREKWVF